MVRNFIIALSLLYYLSSCTHIEESNESKDKVSLQEPKMVEIEILQRCNFSLELIVNGKVETRNKAEIIANYSGIITYNNIYNGKTVAKGDTLAWIENTELKIILQKARITLKEAETELSFLMLGFGGTATDTNSVEKEIFKNLKIRSGYSSALLDLKIANLNYQNTFILAPFSGVVANLESQNNQYTKSGSSLCQIIDYKNYLVEFYVTEYELSKISIGQTIQIQTLTGTGVFSNGNIVEINPIVNKNSLIKIIAKINKPSSTLITGMNVQVSIENIIPNSLAIPKKALVLRNNKKVVFTYKSNRAYWNYVETSAENSDSYLVSDGLMEGDSIIVDGNLNLVHEEIIVMKKQK